MRAILLLALVLAPAATAGERPDRRPPARYAFSYAVEYRGVESNRGFRRLVADTLNDRRGWGSDGRIRFDHDPRDPDFRIALAASGELRGLGCTTERYSCRSKGTVVINAARWWHGVPGFGGKGYRRMLVGHETGHWLGFTHANDYCARVRGRRAPVMMQQSGGRRGCRANPWPLDAERGLLLGRLRDGWRPSDRPGTARISRARPSRDRWVGIVGGASSALLSLPPTSLGSRSTSIALY